MKFPYSLNISKYLPAFIILFFIGISFTLSAQNSQTNSIPSASNHNTLNSTNTASASIQKGKYYIDNGQIRLGIDLDRGGSIFYFALSTNQVNLLNHADEGRFIQQSYYGESDGSTWGGKPWVWNPIQGGGSNGLKAKVLRQELGTNALRVISEPVHWGYGTPMPELEMEEEILLCQEVARIRYTFRNTSTNATDHPAAHQELPAVFVDAAYPIMVYYKGDKPWTGAELTRVTLGWPNEYHIRNEEWAAYVNTNSYGLGVYTPGTPESTAYRYLPEGPQRDKTGPQAAACSYFAPIRTLAITRGLTFQYELYLRIGTIEDIRQTFDQIRCGLHPAATTPFPEKIISENEKSSSLIIRTISPVGATNVYFVPRTEKTKLTPKNTKTKKTAKTLKTPKTFPSEDDLENEGYPPQSSQ